MTDGVHEGVGIVLDRVVEQLAGLLWICRIDLHPLLRRFAGHRLPVRLEQLVAEGQRRRERDRGEL